MLQVEGQLRQKDDMGDALHYIDFHQLQIENKQYVSRIEERNDELLKVSLDFWVTRESSLVGQLVVFVTKSVNSVLHATQGGETFMDYCVSETERK